MPRNVLSLPLRTLLLGALAALALFVVGPQAGSLDDNGDGSPDIPVVVSSPAIVGDGLRSSGVGQQLRSGQALVVLPLLESHTHHIQIDESGAVSGFVFLDGRSVLRTSCLLRC